tara:strand:+ start:2758 stop:3012 length:255 start_codon:yes stop_codon:yes gene_type:complete
MKTIDKKIKELQEQLKDETRYFMYEGLNAGLKVLHQYKAGELDVHDLTRLTQHDPRNQFSWPAQAMVSCRKEIAQFILNNVAKE